MNEKQDSKSDNIHLKELCVRQVNKKMAKANYNLMNKNMVNTLIKVLF